MRRSPLRRCVVIGCVVTVASSVAEAAHLDPVAGINWLAAAPADALPPGVRVIDDFEAGTGHFDSLAAVGTPIAPTFGVTTDHSFTNAYSQRVFVADDPSNAGGWYVRYISGAGSTGSNERITLTNGADGFVGYFLRVGEGTVPAGSLTTQIVLDQSLSGFSDAGVERTVVADGEWHYYEWNLDDPSHWSIVRDGNGNVVPASDGVLPPTGGVSIDSILFRGGNADVELCLDTVAHNPNGTLAPEPATMALAPLAAGALLRRRRR